MPMRRFAVGAAAPPTPAAADIKVPVALVQQVRKRTLAGIMDCRDALAEAQLDVEAAIQLIIQKGKQAAGRDGRVTSEGGISTHAHHNVGLVVELNSETDFVGKSEAFKTVLAQVTSALASAPALSSAALPAGASVHTALEDVQEVIVKDNGFSVSATIALLQSQVGEKLRLRKATALKSDGGVVGAYCHGNRLASLVAVRALQNGQRLEASDKLQGLADALAVHIVGHNPLFVNAPTAEWLAEKEKEHNEEVTPACDGPKPKFSVKKVLHEVTLMDQKLLPFDKPVKQVLASLATQLGADTVEVEGFVREELGSGIEKKANNFAEEVAAAVAKATK